MVKKTRQINIGYFYGYKLNIEVPPELKDLPDDWFEDKFEEWRISERRNAVSEYESNLFLKDIKEKWYKRFLK
jgi:hypothetical protein